MATYSFSSLNNNDSIAFDPNNDVLFFDSVSISAAAVSVAWNGTSITFVADGKQITLTGVTIEQVTTSNITFANGSQLIAGDNLVTTGDGSNNYIVGTTGDDQIIGLGFDFIEGRGGNDVLSGGAGGDAFRASTDGNSTIDGGSSEDILIYTDSGAQGINANLVTGIVVKGGGGTDYVSNVEDVFGTYSDDTLIGNDSANLLLGYDGDDTISGGDAVDNIWGGAGDDVMDGGAGNQDFVQYGSGPLDVGVYVNLQTGDAIDQWGGHDTLSNFEVLAGSFGDDTLIGSASGEIIDGLHGNNLIDGGGGNDTLIDGDGDSTLIGGTGDDHIEGGAGNDTASYSSATAGMGVSLLSGTAGPGEPTPADGFDVLLNVENLEGSMFSDFLEGDGGNNVLSGLDGDDTLWGRAGNDTIYGGDGNDFFDLGAASLRLGDDLYYGDAGDDLIRAGAGNDTFDGGTGVDRVSYFSATAGVYADLSSGQAVIDGSGGFDVLFSIENLSGSLSADTLIGDTGDNWLSGNAGNDTLYGGAGNDTVSYSSAAGGVQVDLAAGTATGADGNDLFYDFENIEGSFFYADVLTGNSAANVITPLWGDDSVDGGAGADTVVFVGNRSEYVIGALPDGSVTVSDTVDRDEFTDGVQSEGLDTVGNVEALHFADSDVEVLNGTSGNNTLIGGSGESVLFGLGGNDILVGGAGNDLMLGGTGADTFKWNAGEQGSVGTPTFDRIADFDAKVAKNTDALDLRDLLQGEHAKKAGGNLAGFLHFSYDAANNQTILEVKSDGGFANKTTTGVIGGADQLIYFTGVDLVGKKTNQDGIIDSLLQVNKLITD